MLTFWGPRGSVHWEGESDASWSACLKRTVPDHAAVKKPSRMRFVPRQVQQPVLLMELRGGALSGDQFANTLGDCWQGGWASWTGGSVNGTAKWLVPHGFDEACLRELGRRLGPTYQLDVETRHVPGVSSEILKRLGAEGAFDAPAEDAPAGGVSE